jgi:ribosomal protein S18 acetylase RimI-like enzyme
VVTAEVAIRTCEARDLDHFGVFGAPPHVRFCREQFARPDILILVATDDRDRPVGKLHIDLGARAGEHIAVVLAAAVVPSLQGRGIGTALLYEAEEVAQNRLFHAVVLGVEDRNPRARRLYERLGYDVVAENDFVYDGSPVPNPGVWMRKAIT